MVKINILSRLSVAKDIFRSTMTYFKKTLPDFLASNLVVFAFGLIFIFKLLFFHAFDNLWPSYSQLGFFLIYTLSSALLLTVPALFFRKFRSKLICLISADIFLTVVLLTDAVYLRFFDTLPVISLLRTSQLGSEGAGWISKLLSPIDLVYLLDFLVLAYLIHRPKFKEKLKSMPVAKNLKTAILFALIPITTLTLMITYDSQAKLPYLFSQISENKVAAKNIGLFGAHILDISRNFVEFFDVPTAADKQNAFATIEKYSLKLSPNDKTGVAAGKRIFMIQVESLNNFVIGEKVDGKEITPNLNKLAASSNYFADDYFTVGSGGTSDADFTTNTSLPPLDNASAFVEYGKDNFTSLEKELKNVGYTTNAFHANSRGYWNRNTVFKNLGFDNFYAKDNYNIDDIINMGLSDKSFLNQTFDKIKNQPVNSFNYIITLSSHYSFEIPNQYKTLNLPTSKYPEMTANYLESVHYTDAALGEFIQKLKDSGMYDDSLIVLYGDHTAKYDAFTDDAGNKIDLNSVSGKRIPLFVKLPGETTGAKYNKPTSHWDIMPTILNLVGAKPASPMFGQDVFGSNKPFFFTLPFENDYEQMISSPYHYLNDGTNLTCTKYSNGKSSPTDISNCDSMLSKRNDIQSAVDLLIKHNLFSDYLKQEK
jgi:lipoteichoic acid synthase